MALNTAKATAVMRGLTAKFDMRLKSATPFYPQLCTVMPSDGADEEYGMLGAIPQVQEWLSDRAFKELRAATYALPNKHWESSLLIKKTDINDDRMGLYGPLLEQLAVRAAYHPDNLLFSSLIVNGESTPCFDGQYYFDTDHAWGDSGTQSNDLTYDATNHAAVTPAEFLAAFHLARTAMMTYRDDQGELLNQPTVPGMSGLMCVVPTQLELAAKTAFGSVIINNSSNIVLDAPRVVVSPHLTTGTKFYLFKTDEVLKPFIFQAREPLSRQSKGINDSETLFVKFMTEARYNLGYGPWWQAVLTTFN